VSGDRVVPVLAFDGVLGTNGVSIAVDATSVYWAQPTAQEIRASAKWPAAAFRADAVSKLVAMAWRLVA